MDWPRLEIPPRIRDAMAYDKFVGDAPRLFVLESQYWLDVACVRAAEAMAWPAHTASVPQEGRMARDACGGLIRALIEFRPDFILSVNLGGMDVDGLLGRLFEDLRIPFVTWFVDDPRTIVMGRSVYASPWAVALTWESAYLDYLRDVGFDAVHHLPLAVDPALFDHPPAEAWSESFTFVGNSMTAAVEPEWNWVRQYPDLAGSVEDALEAGRVTREAFAQGLEAVLPPALVAGLDADQRRHAELLLFVAGTQRLRRRMVAALDGEGLVVRGDENWAAWSSRASGPVNYTHELAACYRDSAVNLNTTSIQMAEAVNQRVFDCPAAGGFLLTDAQADLAKLFEVEREVAVYHDLDECVERYRWFSQRPASRKAIVERARKRILSEHTYAHRLRWMVDVLRERFAGA
ncbi:MAG: glycosyltransferase [Nitrospiraceae bacterium]|nr:glycosyltransferase [Nitrospiraceae bacterium]